MRNIVVDSGPLIALFDGSDRYHEAAKRFLERVHGRLHSNIAVITEVVHMLDFSAQAQHDFLAWADQAMMIDAGAVQGWSFTPGLEIIIGV